MEHSYVAIGECCRYGGIKEMVFHLNSKMLGEVHDHLEVVEVRIR